MESGMKRGIPAPRLSAFLRSAGSPSPPPDVRCVVYLVTNLINGKVYVGRTTGTASTRWRSHVSFSKSGKGSAGSLGAAIREYGDSNFLVELLWTSENETDLGVFEALFVTGKDANNPSVGYNLTADGTAGWWDVPVGTDRQI